MVTRGILIDYHSWAQKRGIDHPATERTCITVKELEQIAKEEQVDFRPGDILIIRSGWVDWYNRASANERVAGVHGDKFIGLEGTEETVAWLWDHHFAAVAGDTLAFEAWPPKPPFRG